MSLVQTPLMLAPSAPVGIFAPVVERSVNWMTKLNETGGNMTKHKALVRLNSAGKPQPLTVVRSTYQMVDMRTLLHAAETAIITALPGTSPHNVTIKDSIAGFGQHCIRQYVFNDMRIDIGALSDVALRIVISNSFGAKSISIVGGAIEFYCSNGLILGDYDVAYHRHTSGLKIGDITSNIANCVAAYSAGVTQWATWTSKAVPHEQAMSLFRAYASSPRQFEQLASNYATEREDRGPTLWAVVSTITNYASNGAIKATQNDTQAVTRMERELSVRDWMNTDVFKSLIAA